MIFVSVFNQEQALVEGFSVIVKIAEGSSQALVRMAGDNGDNQRCADTSKAIKLEVVLDTDTAAGHTIGVTKGGEWARRQQEVVTIYVIIRTIR